MQHIPMCMKEKATHKLNNINNTYPSGFILIFVTLYYGGLPTLVTSQLAEALTCSGKAFLKQDCLLEL